MHDDDGLAFIDPNILLYAYDASAEGAARARGDAGRRLVRTAGGRGERAGAAMIVHSAAELGCRVLWSEDLDAGQVIAGVTVINPFAAPMS